MGRSGRTARAKAVALSSAAAVECMPQILGQVVQPPRRYHVEFGVVAIAGVSPLSARDDGRESAMSSPIAIEVLNARTHNLKGVNCRVPHRQVTVVTGPSGAGKSSLAFDTVFAEGQRRFVESMSTYARQFLAQMERPPIDAMHNVLPSVALEARNAVRNARSTVGTITEVHDVMRLLFTHLGEVRCPKGHGPARSFSPEEAAAALAAREAGERFLLVVRLPRPAKQADAVLGELIRQGYARRLEKGEIVRMETGAKWPRGLEQMPIVPDPARTLGEQPIAPWNTPAYEELYEELFAACRRKRIPLDVPWRDLPEEVRQWIWHGEAPGLGKAKFVHVDRFFRWLESRTYKVHVRVLLARYRAYTQCPACRGARLGPHQHALRARRAHHRSASARQRQAALAARRSCAARQHGAGRRARPHADPRRRLDHRSRPGGRRARRRSRRGGSALDHPRERI